MVSPASSGFGADPIVVAERLSRVFPGADGRPVDVLVDVSLAIHSREVLGVVGANGAGKTTLIDILATSLAATRGTARIAGYDIRLQIREARRALGYLPAGGRALYPRLSVEQNLAFFASLYDVAGQDARARIAASLEMFGASGVARARADRLSDGMAARVALARAILHEPSVLLLDEPDRSIDPAYRRVLLEAVRRYVSVPGRAALLVTHSLDELYGVCDRVVVLRAGRVVESLHLRGHGGDRELIVRAIAGEALA